MFIGKVITKPSEVGMSTDTPQVIDQLVSSFCKEVVKDTSPLYVQVKAEEYALANECFHNVAKKVELDGKFGYGIIF